MSYVRGANPARIGAPSLGAPDPAPMLPRPGARDVDWRGRRASRWDLPRGRLRPALAQLARALAALHAAAASTGTSSRRTCSSRRRGGWCCSISASSARAPSETTFTGAGTPEYMAPEQVAQEPVTRRRRLVCLRRHLVRASRGEAPVPGSAARILYRKQYGRPPRLCEAAPAAPADLAALCDGLLEADRSDAGRPRGCSTSSRPRTLGESRLHRRWRFGGGARPAGPRMNARRWWGGKDERADN